MMKEYKLFGYLVEIDKEATKDWYYTFKGWRCDCGHCQNFLLLAKKKELPNAVLDTLIAFGVLPEKPTYVCEIASEEGQILYQFSYRMAERSSLYIKDGNVPSQITQTGGGSMMVWIK